MKHYCKALKRNVTFHGAHLCPPDTRCWHCQMPFSKLLEEEKPLFVPLCAGYFEAFERGEKTEEYRQFGARWNAATCRVARRVLLSYGYGKARRRLGVIKAFRKELDPHRNILEWTTVYPLSLAPAACIGIELMPKGSACDIQRTGSGLA